MSILKFPALAIGQSFLWRDTLYVKTSPVLARAQDSGQSQMIPRSAQVELSNSVATQPTASTEQLLSDLHAQAISCLETLAKNSTASTKALTQARKKLDTALKQALARIDKKP